MTLPDLLSLQKQLLRQHPRLPKDARPIASNIIAQINVALRDVPGPKHMDSIKAQLVKFENRMTGNQAGE